MFGYWSAFVPDSPGVGTGQGGSTTLFTVIMKDPSPRVRTGALAVLTALVDGSKQYLMAAEERYLYHCYNCVVKQTLVCGGVGEGASVVRW